MKSFADLELIEPLQRALEALDYERPTPIQQQAIPPLLDGADVLGCAQTGTGKTAAFALPVLQLLALKKPPLQQRRSKILALVLSPTRELAAQIGDSFTEYGRFLDIDHTVIVGGVNEKSQIAALRRGISVLVATPGRLLDLYNRGYIDFKHVEFFILDEADRMLDMGFIHDIRKVLNALPAKRQNLLFSATMPSSIVKLSSSFLDDPVHVSIEPDEATVDLIEQSVMFVERSDKKRLIVDLFRNLNIEQSIVFTRTKHGANRLTKVLCKAGIEAAAIHGNKSQNARIRALNGFKSGDVAVLVATDIASRGIDVAGVSHVFNYDLPNEPEVYVHRIGRTGRAGQQGVAIAFCDPTEGEYLRDIERLIGEDLPQELDHPYHCQEAIPPIGRRSSGRGRGRGQSQRGRGRGGSNDSRRGSRPSRGGGGRSSSDSTSRGRSSEQSERSADPNAPSNASQGQTAGGASKRRRRRRAPGTAPPGEASRGASQASGQAAKSSAPAVKPAATSQSSGEDQPPRTRRRRRRRRRPES